MEGYFISFCYSLVRWVDDNTWGNLEERTIKKKSNRVHLQQYNEKVIRCRFVRPRPVLICLRLF